MIDDGSSTSHSIVKSIIDNLPIKCKNQHVRNEALAEGGVGCDQDGEYHSCDWNGMLCEYKSHAETSCPLEVVTCQANGCDACNIRVCMTVSGYCTKIECVTEGAKDFLTDETRDMLLQQRDITPPATPAAKEEVGGSLDENNGEKSDDDNNKENIGNNTPNEREVSISSNSSNPDLTGSGIAAKHAATGGSLLTRRALQLCLEADKILSKQMQAETKQQEDATKRMMSPQKLPSSSNAHVKTKRIHDEDQVMSPQPWVVTKNSTSIGGDISKTRFEPSPLRQNGSAKKQVVDPAIDITNNLKKNNLRKDFRTPTPLIMPSAKVLANDEMTKFQQQQHQIYPEKSEAVNEPIKHHASSHDSIEAMFVHRRLMDFCRSWMRQKPDALYDFVVYRPKIDQSMSSSNTNINRLLCGIPGPKRTGWDGGLFPVLVEWSGADVPPTCCFPEDFHHANVKSSGLVSLSTLKDDWHPEITIPEILFDIQQLLAHPNHDSAQPEARASKQSGMYDYKTMIQTSVYVPSSLLEMATGIDSFEDASSWQLVNDEALYSRSGLYSNPEMPKTKDPVFMPIRDSKLCNCSCCAWGQTMWDSGREMRYLFGAGCY